MVSYLLLRRTYVVLARRRNTIEARQSSTTNCVPRLGASILATQARMLGRPRG